MTRFYLASSDDDYAAAGALFTEYAASIKINLGFQHFDDELASLKTMYGKPSGGIVLAAEQEEIIGCVAVRKINDNTGELKRMYIKPQHQHKRIGKSLLAKALLLAKECKYTAVKLDTLSDMLPAIHLYKAAGFYEIPAYYHNPISTAVYFEKLL